MTPEHLQPAPVIRPGDTLLVVAGRDVTPENAEQVRTALLARLPTLGDVVVIGAEQIAVVRP